MVKLNHTELGKCVQLFGSKRRVLSSPFRILRITII